jgi:hypothetical protein
MSAYVDSLDAVAQDRYFRKCALLGVDTCSYSIQEDAWVDDATVWPSVIWPEVHEYLINSVGQFTNSAMKAFTYWTLTGTIMTAGSRLCMCCGRRRLEPLLC